jgi:hypothetical protein
VVRVAVNVGGVRVAGVPVVVVVEPGDVFLPGVGVDVFVAGDFVLVG